MSVRSFRPVMSVATVAVAALGCYLVSLRVAAERAGLEDIETKIVLAQRDIRSLQTEIGTRGRLEQLESWNVKVLALSAPKADQFVDGGYQLARLARPDDQVDIAAPVVLASVPKPRPAAPSDGDDAGIAVIAASPATTPATTPVPEPKPNRGPASLMHVASYSVSEARSPAATPAESRKLSPESAQIAPATARPGKIATVARKPVLPAAASEAKAASPRKLAVKQAATTIASREKAPH